MIRFGTVSIINHDKGTVKVHFEDIGEQSAELIVYQGRNKGVKQYSMPQMGERGLCLIVSNGTSGMYLGSGYDIPEPVMSNAGEGKTVTLFRDGTQIIYDENSSKLYLNCKKEVEVISPQIKLTGDITINGNVKLNGQLDSTGDVKAGGVSVRKHTHTGVKAGSDTSGTPA